MSFPWPFTHKKKTPHVTGASIKQSNSLASYFRRIRAKPRTPKPASIKEFKVTSSVSKVGKCGLACWLWTLDSGRGTDKATIRPSFSAWPALGEKKQFSRHAVVHAAEDLPLERVDRSRTALHIPAVQIVLAQRFDQPT